MKESLAEKFVFICSPYRPESSDPEERARELFENIRLAKMACHAAVKNGYVPMAPHLYFTQFLDDNCEDQRDIGREMALAWVEDCLELWVIGDRITEGMAEEIAVANVLNLPIKIKSFAELEAMA